MAKVNPLRKALRKTQEQVKQVIIFLNLTKFDAILLWLQIMLRTKIFKRKKKMSPSNQIATTGIDPVTSRL